jgi:phosphatidylinositol alpha 1,6-mannosyltransferase
MSRGNSAATVDAAAGSSIGRNPQTPQVQLRVALFTGNYNYIKDGVALTLNRLVRYLESRNIPVLIFAPVGPAPAFESAGELVPVPSIPIPFRPEYRISLGLPRSAREKLAAFKPTLFHIAVPDILGYRALKLADEWKVPVVASYHTRYDTYLKSYGLTFLEDIGKKYLRWFYSKCRQVYPPSESMAAILKDEGLAQNIRIWSRGVDSTLFDPARRSMDWRRSHGINDDEVVVAYVGRLVKEKNTALLARVFTTLNNRGVPFRGLIVGNGPEEAAMKAALPDAVFAGFLHGETLATAYASSDIFFFPSESETFGNVTLEAMASGLPSVCADASGSRSLVIEGETGFLAPAASEAALVDHLAKLIADESLRSRMAQAARARALEFNWERSLSELCSNYAEVLNSPAMPGKRSG